MTMCGDHDLKIWIWVLSWKLNKCQLQQIIFRVVGNHSLTSFDNMRSLKCFICNQCVIDLIWNELGDEILKNMIHHYSVLQFRIKLKFFISYNKTFHNVSFVVNVYLRKRNTKQTQKSIMYQIVVILCPNILQFTLHFSFYPLLFDYE